jgi:hypothetical protein
MKQSLSTPIVIGILVVVVLVIGLFYWRSNAPQVPASSQDSQTTSPNFQKHANPQDLAKQYGYGNRPTR